MSSGLAAPVLTALHMVTYAGYGLLAGILAFWVVVWPGGGRDRRLSGLVVAGAALLAVGTLGDPLIRVTVGDQALGDVLDPVTAGALMVRLAALAAVAFFLPDLVRDRITGWRQWFAFVVVIALAASIVTGSTGTTGSTAADDGTRRETVQLLASSGHVLAAAVWVGCLVALAVLLLPPGDPGRLEQLGPLVTRVSAVSLVVLVASGAVRAVAVAGDLSDGLVSGFGLLVGVKVVLLAGAVALGLRVRRGQTPLRLVCAQVVLALGALGATALLVAAANG